MEAILARLARIRAELSEVTQDREGDSLSSQALLEESLSLLEKAGCALRTASRTMRDRWYDRGMPSSTDAREAPRRSGYRRSDVLIQLLVENTSDILWTADLSLRPDYVSPAAARLPEGAVERIVKRAATTYLTPERLAALCRPDSCSEPVAPERYEFSLSESGRPDLYTETTVSCLRDPEGVPLGLLGVTRNITERREFEARLLHSEKLSAVGRFAGEIAHDFNNLLTVIHGHAVRLLESLPPDAPPSAEVRPILQSTDLAASVTRQLLAVSRHQVLREETFDLSEALSDLSLMLDRMTGEKVHFRFVPARRPCPVLTDRSQVERTILNLVSNACDAMPAGGSLTMSVGAPEQISDRESPGPGRWCRLTVADTGSGMSPAVLDRAFEPFFTTKERGLGTGLGLSSVHGFVRQSSGHVLIDSQDGQGTSVRVYLPWSAMPASIAPQSGDLESPSTLRGTETILLVEDEPLVRQLSAAILSDLGYDVITAGSAETALLRVRRHGCAPDALVADLVLPGADGRALHKQLGAILPGIPALFLSGYSSDSTLRHGLREHGAPFLQKPFAPKALAIAVRSLLEGRI